MFSVKGISHVWFRWKNIDEKLSGLVSGIILEGTYFLRKIGQSSEALHMVCLRSCGTILEN